MRDSHHQWSMLMSTAERQLGAAPSDVRDRWATSIAALGTRRAHWLAATVRRRFGNFWRNQPENRGEIQKRRANDANGSIVRHGQHPIDRRLRLEAIHAAVERQRPRGAFRQRRFGGADKFAEKWMGPGRTRARFGVE
jgi:hypothetical protein